MSYYATKIVIDEQTLLPVVEAQILVGAPPADYWNLNVVSDENGNSYFSYGNNIGVIKNAENPLNILSRTFTSTQICGTTRVQIKGLALYKESGTTYLYFLATYTSYSYFYRINVNTLLDWGVSNPVADELPKNDSALTQSKRATKITLDKNGNIWFTLNSLSSSTSKVYCLTKSSGYAVEPLIGAGVATAVWTDGFIGVCDHRGYFWYASSTNEDILRYTYLNGQDTAFEAVINKTTTYSTDNIIDIMYCSGVVGGSRKHYLVCLSNTQADQTTVNRIIVYDITDPTLATLPSYEWPLSTFVECSNLHAKNNVDLTVSVFFSTWHPTDGYNTHKINLETGVITPYITGLGSKTVSNDPHGYFLSQYGHTGYNVL